MEYLYVLIRRFSERLSLPRITVIDIIEILVFAYAIYMLLKWIKDTKAWMLLKGLIVIVAFVIVAAITQMTAVLWLVQRLVSILAISAVIVFQPEIRRALEKLGEKDIFASFLQIDMTKSTMGQFSDKIVNEISRACHEMAAAKTGALIVIERKTKLAEAERTGIMMESLVSSQLLINIFEHNTPLHDGAVILRGNRIVAATCYLPLSDNRSLSKNLGTRHRAGVGITEISDALAIIVSEETGHISVAMDGKLDVNLTDLELKERLKELQTKETDKRKLKFKLKGRS